MTGLVDRYLAALVKHDASGLPLSKGVRFTENTAETACGWAHAKRPPPSRFTPSIRPPRSIKIQGVPGVDTIPMGGATSNLQAAEIFKIRGGKIHEIEAMGVSLPYGAKSGWE
jgi:hypothetical protein